MSTKVSQIKTYKNGSWQDITKVYDGSGWKNFRGVYSDGVWYELQSEANLTNLQLIDIDNSNGSSLSDLQTNNGNEDLSTDNTIHPRYNDFPILARAFLDYDTSEYTNIKSAKVFFNHNNLSNSLNYNIFVESNHIDDVTNDLYTFFDITKNAYSSLFLVDAEEVSLNQDAIDEMNSVDRFKMAILCKRDYNDNGINSPGDNELQNIILTVYF